MTCAGSRPRDAAPSGGTAIAASAAAHRNGRGDWSTASRRTLTVHGWGALALAASSLIPIVLPEYPSRLAAPAPVITAIGLRLLARPVEGERGVRQWISRTLAQCADDYLVLSVVWLVLRLLGYYGGLLLPAWFIAIPASLLAHIRVGTAARSPNVRWQSLTLAVLSAVAIAQTVRVHVGLPWKQWGFATSPDMYLPGVGYVEELEGIVLILIASWGRALDVTTAHQLVIPIWAIAFWAALGWTLLRARGRTDRCV
jgi:hypothetical protein